MTQKILSMMYKKTVGCSKINLKKIRDFVFLTLENLNVDAIQANLIAVAVDEVCANRIIHSHQCNDRHMIQIRITNEPRGLLTIEIADSGQTFDIEAYQIPNMEDIVRDRKSGGMGLILVKKIMDHIQVDTIGHLNVCRLYKQLA